MYGCDQHLLSLRTAAIDASQIESLNELLRENSKEVEVVFATGLRLGLGAGTVHFGKWRPAGSRSTDRRQTGGRCEAGAGSPVSRRTNSSAGTSGVRGDERGDEADESGFTRPGFALRNIPSRGSLGAAAFR